MGDAKDRESKAFDEVAAPGSGLVLFGAGNLGRRTLAGLRKIGIEPRCFVDNNSSRWGLSLDGLPLIGPEEAARLYGPSATFVVSIWGALGNDRMSTRIEQNCAGLAASRLRLSFRSIGNSRSCFFPITPSIFPIMSIWSLIGFVTLSAFWQMIHRDTNSWRK